MFASIRSFLRINSCSDKFFGDCLINNFLDAYFGVRISEYVYYSVLAGCITLIVLATITLISRSKSKARTSGPNLTINNNVSNQMSSVNPPRAQNSVAPNPVIPNAVVANNPISNPAVQNPATAIQVSPSTTNSSRTGSTVATATPVVSGFNLPPLELYNKNMNMSYYLKKLDRQFQLLGVTGNKVTLFLQYMGQEIEEELEHKKFVGDDEAQYQAMTQYLLDKHREPRESDYETSQAYMTLRQRHGEKKVEFFFRARVVTEKAYPLNNLPTLEVLFKKALIQGLDSLPNRSFLMDNSQFMTCDAIEAYLQKEDEKQHSEEQRKIFNRMLDSMNQQVPNTNNSFSSANNAQISNGGQTSQVSRYNSSQNNNFNGQRAQNNQNGSGHLYQRRN
jgi:hypothetical protein